MVNVIDLSDIGAAREDEKPKSKGIHIAVIEPGKDPYLKKVAPDADGSYLGAFQDEVGGLVEAYEPPFGETPLLYRKGEYRAFTWALPPRSLLGAGTAARATRVRQSSTRQSRLAAGTTLGTSSLRKA